MIQGTSNWKYMRIAILMLIDILLITIAYYSAFVLRLDSFGLGEYRTVFINTLGLVLGVHLVSFWVQGMYREVWRFANFYSGLLIGRSVFTGIVISVLLLYLLGFQKLPPRSVPIIYWCLACMAIAGVRFGWRAFSSFKFTRTDQQKKRCFIYGAGTAGEQLARHIAVTPKFPYKVVGFIDDDPNKKNRTLHGKKILGSGHDIENLAKVYKVETILIAMHAASGQVVRNIVTKCQAADLKPLILPEISSTMGLDVIQPRPIDVGDLLRRAPKSINKGAVVSFFQGKVVLVTGAGGSIGSEIARQVLEAQPETLILLDSSEYNLYRIELELSERNTQGHTRIFCAMGSLVDDAFLNDVFARYRPDAVLHAAAYKHVPLVEANPLSGIFNNVKGTLVLAELAVKFGVKHMLLISSDKAVRPTSVMGQTKRVCEILVQALQKKSGGKTRFCAVRFGNVLGSSGSVIPRFIEQIQAGGPVTVTDQRMTRYFMLTSEAVALVLQSVIMSKGGEIFVLNMGEPVNIYEMAKQLIRLAGKEPGKDVEIVFTGLRPGEKLFEELILDGVEDHTEHEDVYLIRHEGLDAENALLLVKKLVELSQNYENIQALTLLKYLSSETFGKNGVPNTIAAILAEVYH